MACWRTELMRESSGSSWICFWMGDMEVSMRGAGHHRPPAATSQGMGPLFSLGRLHSLPGLQWREPADSSNPVQSPQFKAFRTGLTCCTHAGLSKNCFSSPVVGKSKPWTGPQTLCMTLESGPVEFWLLLTFDLTPTPSRCSINVN